MMISKEPASNDDYRINYLREHIKAIGEENEDGIELMVILHGDVLI
jgi:6-phospho-beta-glucosidase